MALWAGVLLAVLAVLVLPPSRSSVAAAALQRLAAERAAWSGAGPVVSGDLAAGARGRTGTSTGPRLRALCVGVITVVGVTSAWALVGVPGGLVVGGAGWTVLWWRRRRRARAATGRSAATGRACLSMAGELAAGSTPASALEAAAREWPELLGPAAGRAAIGGDVAAELRAGADAPGAGALRAVAAAWALSERTGARLADTLTVVADSLRTEDGIRREAAASLAGAHVTARTLAVLPVLTLLGTSAGGAQPWRFLFGTPAGGVCLVIASVLVIAGLSWVSWVSRRATASRWERRT